LEVKFRHLEGRMYLVANEASFKAAAGHSFVNNGCINKLDEEDWKGINGETKRNYPAVVTFYGAIGTTHEPSASWITLAKYIEQLTAKVDAISNF
jgi:hypothetical protein